MPTIDETLENDDELIDDGAVDAALQVVLQLSGRFGALEEGNEGAKARLRLSLAASYLAEYLAHRSHGASEPDALARAARGELPLG